MQLFFTLALPIATLAIQLAVPATAAEGPRLSLLPAPSNIHWVRPLPGGTFAVSYRTTQAGLDILHVSGRLLRRYWPLPFGAECLALFPDGGLLLGGGNRLHRLNSDGTSDPGFAAEILPFETYGPAIIQADGGVVFATFSPGTPIARVDSMGRLQANFAAGVLPPLPNLPFVNLEQQTDGKIVVGGTLGGLSSFLYRMNADGSRDDSLFRTISGDLTRLLLSPDGEILANLWDGSDLRLVRLKPDGSLQSVIDTEEFHLRTNANNGVAMLDDGSVITAPGQVYRFYPDATSETREISEWPDFFVSDLIPLSSDRVALVYRASCQGGGCYARRLLRIVPLKANDQPFAWQPPHSAPNLFLAEGLVPEVRYELGVSDDLQEWRFGDAESGYPSIDEWDCNSLGRSEDGRTMMIFICSPPQSEAPARRRFYRLRTRE